MLIRSRFDIQLSVQSPVAMVAMLHVHPSLDAQLVQPETFQVESLDGNTATPIASDQFMDGFGNRCERFLAPTGLFRLTGMSLLEHPAQFDPIDTAAVQHPVQDLPVETLQFLLSSRYCQVDQLSHAATDIFGHVPEGWSKVIAIRDWVHNHVTFDYTKARPTKTALDVFTERVGVCRDFQHLAITLTRAMNIPARYVTGYLGDIRHRHTGPGDFSAWYEVFLSGKWWTMDARHNGPRVGRVLMATGRDATDVALTTSFGVADLKYFHVESKEVLPDGSLVPIPGAPDVKQASQAQPAAISQQQQQQQTASSAA